METRKIASNLDTNFLKLAALVCMTFDHVGSNFFPDMPLFRIIGRLAFPSSPTVWWWGASIPTT